MTKFEIFIPAADANSFNMTLKVQADTWMAALKLGVAKLQLPIAINDVVVDVRDDHTINVTEPATGKQFRITEIIEAPASVMPPLVAPAKQPPAPSASEAAFLQALTPAPVVPVPVVQAPVMPAAAPLPLGKRVLPKVAAQKPAQPPKTRAPKRAQVAEHVAPETLQPTIAPRDEAHEDRMVAAFHRATDILMRVKTPSEAASAFLDGALELVPAEAGAIFFSNIAEKDLFVAAARGPSASYALAQRVPMGQGIIGTAVEAAMPIGSFNVTSDPRYSPDVPESLGVKLVSIASSPIQKDGRTFGVLHLVNRHAQGAFTSDELELLAYFSQRFADFLDRYLSIAA